MKINQNFFDYIEPVLKNIKRETKGDYMIFGSAILYLFDILEFKEEDFHDIDVMVKSESSIPKEAKLFYFQNDKDKRLFKYFIGDFEVDFGGIWPETEGFFRRALDNTIEINGYRFVSLKMLQEWKEMIGREKDLLHVEKIKEFRRSHQVFD